MKSWSYSELAEKLPTTWKILERLQRAHDRREKKKRPKSHTSEAFAIRREIEDLLHEVEAANKCQHCREIEALSDRIDYLENKDRDS